LFEVDIANLEELLNVDPNLKFALLRLIQLKIKAFEYLGNEFYPESETPYTGASNVDALTS